MGTLLTMGTYPSVRSTFLTQGYVPIVRSVPIVTLGEEQYETWNFIAFKT